MKRLICKIVLKTLKRKNQDVVEVKSCPVGLINKDEMRVVQTKSLKTVPRDFSKSYYFPRLALYLTIKLVQEGYQNITIPNFDQKTETIAEIINQGELERARKQQYDKYQIERTKQKSDEQTIYS
jgi:hypothetical protein